MLPLVWFAAGAVASYILTQTEVLSGLTKEDEPRKLDERPVTEYKELPKWSKRGPVTLEEHAAERKDLEEKVYNMLVESAEKIFGKGEKMVEKMETFRKNLDQATGGCCGGTKDDCCHKH